MNPWIFWNERFPGCPPVGFILRQIEKDRWIRFHHLPNGRRFPSTASDLDEILRRCNRVSSAVLGSHARIIGWIASHGDTPPIGWSIADSPPVWNSDVQEELGEPPPIFYFVEKYWKKGILDDLFVAAASDHVGPVGVFSVRTGGVFCPYNGGMDVIVNDARQLTTLKARFKQWTSPLPSGL